LVPVDQFIKPAAVEQSNDLTKQARMTYHGSSSLSGFRWLMFSQT
jgi:hypothetical protein